LIIAQCMMWVDTKALYEQAQEKGFSKKAQTPKTIAKMHEMALEARAAFRPDRFEDPSYQPTLSCL
jgi:hypothetical protein